MNLKDKQFSTDSEQDWEDLGGGLKRKIMSYDDNIMLVKVSFEKGGVGTLHQHHHTQMSYIDSGVFEITINGITKSLQNGDVYYVPPHAVHGALCLEKGILIDVFTPLREDFLPQ